MLTAALKQSQAMTLLLNQRHLIVIKNRPVQSPEERLGVAGVSVLV